MGKEAEQAGEQVADEFKAKVFASAFGSVNPQTAIKQYYEWFEKDKEPETDYDIEEFEPQSEEDVLEMFNAARRAGVIA